MSIEKYVPGCEKRRKTIDRYVQEQINGEKRHWEEVLLRITSAIKFIAKNNLAFYGVKDEFCEENSGVFSFLTEMLNEFDQVMKIHFRRMLEHDTQYPVLGRGIQNELITILAGEVKSTIVKKIKKAKYFSVIVDCTLDVDGEEQISLVLRCVDAKLETPIKVEEFYLEFLKRVDTSGRGLFGELIDVMRTLELNIEDLRGLVYGNGFNMRAKQKEVQKKLLEMNPRAFYMPRGCHSLNSVFCDIVRSCSRGSSVFGAIGCLYSFFSSSPYEWNIFKDNVKGFTDQPLPQTRWVSHLEYVKAIRFQAPKIVDALNHIEDTCPDLSTSGSSKFLTYELENFEFLFGMAIWYDILFAVNEVSKKFQTQDAHIDFSIDQLKGLVSFFETYRETGFKSAMIVAKEIAADLDVEPVFPKKCTIRRKVQFNEDVNDDPTQSAEESFRVGYFLYIIDEARASLECMIEQFQAYEEMFGFLFDLKKLNSADNSSLKSFCCKLEDFLKHGMHTDIDGCDLFMELKSLKKVLPRDVKNAVEVLNFIVDMHCCFPNAWIAYRVLLTIPRCPEKDWTD